MKSVADMSMEELAAYVCEALAREGIETVDAVSRSTVKGATLQTASI
jgi:isopentenyl phosphate kinase